MFELNRKGLNLPRGVASLGVLLVPLIVLAVLEQEKYLLSVFFGALFVGLSDPGGGYLQRVSRLAEVGVIGAVLTALGFGIGGQAWGFAVLAAFVVTLLGGLAATFGLHRLVVAMLLNVWFIVALGLPASYQLDPLTRTVSVDREGRGPGRQA